MYDQTGNKVSQLDLIPGQHYLLCLTIGLESSLVSLHPSEPTILSPLFSSSACINFSRPLLLRHSLTTQTMNPYWNETFDMLVCLHLDGDRCINFAIGPSPKKAYQR